MDNARLLMLLNRYLANEASPEEIDEIDKWYDSFDTAKGLLPEELQAPDFNPEKTFLQSSAS